jgi:signal transduction histidine kinase
LYGLIPLALILIVLYLALWLTYRISRRTISPIIQLAEKLDKIDFSGNDFSSLEIGEMSISNDDDVQILADAIENMGQRLELFTQRERNFTRDASHELRSPLTVINIAADMILSGQQLTESGIKSVQRIKRAITDMEELTEAFLLLARESEQSLTQDTVSLNEIVRDEIERSELLKKNKDLKINLKEEANLYTKASDKVVSVLIGNLIRNAILYTDKGNVTITIEKQCVEIADSGKGIEQEQVKQLFQPFFRASENTHGHGVGLTIVKRLSDRFNWPIEIDSEIGKGTRVKICFQ